jgi:hypothetical protein
MLKMDGIESLSFEDNIKTIRNNKALVDKYNAKTYLVRCRTAIWSQLFCLDIIIGNCKDTFLFRYR